MKGLVTILVALVVVLPQASAGQITTDGKLGPPVRSIIQAQDIRDAIDHFLKVADLATAGLADSMPLHWGELSTSGPEPVLEVRSVAWDARQQKLQFRLRCVNRKACPCFLVYADLPRELVAVWRDRLLHGAASAAGGLATRRNVSAPILARAGKIATLIFRTDGIRISMKVVCLQRGSLGQTIRARDPATHRVFVAKVVGPNELRGSL